MKCLFKLALLFCSVFLLATTVTSAQELNVVGSWSNLTMHKNFEKPFWTETVPAALPEFSVKLSSLGTIAPKGPEVLHRLAKGEYDVVHTCADYVASDSQALAGLDMPVLAPEIGQAHNVTEAYRPVVADALAQDYNGKLLAITPYPAHAIFCREKFTELDDLKGRKIRVSGWSTSEFAKTIGAIGVNVAFNKVFDAFQSGEIDCAHTGTLSGYYADWGKVANYVYPMLIGGWDYVLTVMNMDTWNGLSPEEQKKLQGLVNEKLEKPVWETTARESKEGLDCLTGGTCPHGEANNMSLVPLSMTDLVRARMILTDDILPAWGKLVSTETSERWNATAGKQANLRVH